MKLQDYVKLSERTLINKGVEMNLLHAEMGSFTEIGELIDAEKKKIFYGKELDSVNVKEEIGDIFWYQAIFIREHKMNPIDFNNIMTAKESVSDFIQVLGLLKKVTDTDAILRRIDLNDNAIYQFIADNLERLVLVSNYYKINVEDALQINIDKLSKRYPEKFTEEKALNRDLKAERKILES